LRSQNSSLSADAKKYKDNFESALRDLKDLADLLNISYRFEDGSNLRGRVSRNDYDLLSEVRRAGGLDVLIKAFNNRNNN